MRVTYIGHSGFAAELAHCTLLFDYFEGALPAFAPEKPLYVFSSHAHRDHFNFDIFKLRETHPNVTYILSRDIRRRWSAAGFRRHGVEQETYDAILFPGAHETLQCGALSVETLRSTDEGVAFLIQDGQELIYHAGDLNDWVWEGEPDSDNRRMTESYRRQIALLAEELGGRSLTAAFVVLDPRQEADYDRGMLYFLQHIGGDRVYPMHYWGKPQIIDRFLQEHPQYRGRIMRTEN